MSFLKEFKNEDWAAQVLESPDPVLVEFRAPDKTIPFQPPVQDRLYTLWGHRLHMGYVDVSRSLPLAIFYRIQDLPTLCLFHQGKILKTWRGPHHMDLMLAASTTLQETLRLLSAS